MFISSLKRQYWAYFLVVLSISLTSVFTRGFTEPLLLGIAVEVFMLFSTSFILFCIGFCFMKLYRVVKRNLDGKSSIFKALTLVLLLLFICSALPSDADANLLRAGATFIAGVGFGAACSDLWNAGKEAVTEAVKDVVEAVKEHADNSYYCGRCGRMVSGSHQCSDNYYYDGSYGY